MALSTITVVDSAIQGNQKVVNVSFVFDASYPTGGYTLTPAQVGLYKIVSYTPTMQGGFGAPQNLYLVNYNITTQKVQVYWTGGAVAGVLSEVTAATNLQAGMLASNLIFQGF